LNIAEGLIYLKETTLAEIITNKINFTISILEFYESLKSN